MEKYKSHKVVEAGKIEWIEGNTVCFVGGETLEIPEEVFARGRPSEGDYIVRYKDGYLSWSPCDVFKQGYSIADPVGAA